MILYSTSRACSATRAHVNNKSSNEEDTSKQIKNPMYKQGIDKGRLNRWMINLDKLLGNIKSS